MRYWTTTPDYHVIEPGETKTLDLDAICVDPEDDRWARVARVNVHVDEGTILLTASAWPGASPVALSRTAAQPMLDWSLDVALPAGAKINLYNPSGQGGSSSSGSGDDAAVMVMLTGA